MDDDSTPFEEDTAGQGRLDRMRSRSVVRFVGAVAVVVLAVASVWVLLPRYRPGLRSAERYGIDGDFVDERFTTNWQEAGAAGLDRGAYHFFTLCRPGSEQAANFLSVAVPDPADPAVLAPAVDLELKGNCTRRPTRQQVSTQLRVFLDRVEQAWGRKVLIYTSDDFDGVYPGRDLGRPLWEATYYRRPAGHLPDPPGGLGRAAVDGVSGRVDLDIGR